MGNPPDALLRLAEARDITESSPADSDCVPSRTCFGRDRKVFLSGDYREEQLRAEFLNPRVIDFALVYCV